MTRIVTRHDTAANWTSVNPILAKGEMGIEDDTRKFKFGDGVNPWSQLPYASAEAGTPITGTSPIKVENNKVSLDIDNQTIQINSQGQLACNLDEIGSDLTSKANVDLSNISDAGKQVIKDNAGSVDTSKLVTTDTDQTISGNKTFTEGIKLVSGGSCYIKSNGTETIIADSYHDPYSSTQNVLRFSGFPYIKIDSAASSQGVSFTGQSNGAVPFLFAKSSETEIGVKSTSGSYNTQINGQNIYTCRDGSTKNDLVDTSNLGNFVDGTTITYDSSTKKLSAAGGGSTAPDNMVTTNTTQTISSIKTFSSGIDIGKSKFYQGDGANNNTINIGSNRIEGMVIEAISRDTSRPRQGTIQIMAGSERYQVLDTGTAFKQQKVTQAEYNDLTNKDENTMYVITDAPAGGSPEMDWANRQSAAITSTNLFTAPSNGMILLNNNNSSTVTNLKINGNTLTKQDKLYINTEMIVNKGDTVGCTNGNFEVTFIPFK